MSYDTRSVTGELYGSFESLKEHGELGDFCFIDNDSAIIIRMPDGPNYPSARGSMIRWPLKPGHNLPGVDQDAVWNWDGNRNQPTLTPSLHWVDVWHGWMRAGKLESV